MDPTLLLLRWAHVLAAIVAMGGLFFARFALVPALSEIDSTTRDRIHDAIRPRWLPWVIGAITVLVASGLANFLLFNGRVKAEGWANGQWMRETSYHALFGAKVLLAVVAFYFASALVGRGAGTQWVRNDRAKPDTRYQDGEAGSNFRSRGAGDSEATPETTPETTPEGTPKATSEATSEVAPSP